MDIRSYRFAMLLYIEHVHLQSIYVILHPHTCLKNTETKCKKYRKRFFFYSETLEL